MKTTKYMVVRHFDLDKLVEEVNQRLNSRWVCQGGISSIPGNSGYHYYIQAMTFTEKTQ